MNLRIRADQIDLPQATRNAIEGHFRIALGSRSARFRSARIGFSRGSDAAGQVCCKISLRGAGGLSESFEETARDLQTAMEWAIWRLIHSLDRKALRASHVPPTANTPGAARSR